MVNLFDYFDDHFTRDRVLLDAGNGEFEPAEISDLTAHQIYGVLNTVEIQSSVRSYFEAAWRYYGLIPAISAILIAASSALDRRLSTLTLATFALASAASHIAFSTEPVVRYLIVSAWVNIVVAGRIASVLATRLWPTGVSPPITAAGAG